MYIKNLTLILETDEATGENEKIISCTFEEDKEEEDKTYLALIMDRDYVLTEEEREICEKGVPMNIIGCKKTIFSLNIYKWVDENYSDTDYVFVYRKKNKVLTESNLKEIVCDFEMKRRNAWINGPDCLHIFFGGFNYVSKFNDMEVYTMDWDS
jgi:protein involved in sex pheromone biosynthesis